jgi:spore germination protein YaaH
VSVWLPYWSMQAALDSTLAGADAIGTAHPFWYAIAGDGRIEDDTGAGDSGVISALRARGLAVAPTVTELAGLRAFDAILVSPSRRAAVVRAIVAIAESSGGYSGVDLDFEQFAVDRAHDAAAAVTAAALYPKLVAQACAALHAIGRTCTVTVMPRTGAAHSFWRGRLATWVYDYTALARAADQVEIMAYDEHASHTPPGPVAPYAWVRAIIAYARATMPADRTVLALPAYGYDWSGTRATAITARAAPLLAAAHSVAPTWSAAQRENTFRYGAGRAGHVVWYEPAAATAARAKLAAAAGLAGVAIWAAGDEEPQLWGLLDSLERTYH